MHITLIFMCKYQYGSVHFKFGFDFFLKVLYVWVFYYFLFFFKVHSEFLFITEWQHWF